MIRFAAQTDDGQRFRATTRREVDDWARERCAEGANVDVYCRDFRSSSADGIPILVGKWRQPGVE